MSLEQLRRRVREAVADPDLSGPYRHAGATARAKRQRTVQEMGDWEEQRRRATAIRRDSIDNLEELLNHFRRRFTDDGGVVHEAADAQEAREIVLEILKEHGAHSVIKGKSMLSEEVELNAHLAAEGVRVHETDLGEFIVQVAGQRPSHITAPALHMDRATIDRLFAEKLGRPYTEDAVELTLTAREILRERFLTADAGITGANFLVAETGHIVLLENEANIRMCTTLPRVHIALVGLEKIVRDFEDLGPLLSVIARSATGQKIGAYTSLLGAGSAPPRHVVLVDNGRRALAANPHRRETLACIRCGACLNVCPVYEQIGGHAYDSAYAGPIGAVLGTTGLGTDHGRDLAYASSLCGACAEVCPVGIDLPELLRHGRQRYLETGGAPVGERLAWWLWSKILVRPGLYRLLAGMARSALAGPAEAGADPPPLRAWTGGRCLPRPAPRSFVEQWKARGGRTTRGGIES